MNIYEVSFTVKIKSTIVPGWMQQSSSVLIAADSATEAKAKAKKIIIVPGHHYLITVQKANCIINNR